MSGGAVRSTDFCSGHGDYLPRPPLTFSFTVLINKLGAVRMGDIWTSHCDNSCHIGAQIGASKTVYANGLPLARTGDEIACGSFCLGSSTNVIIGG